LKPIINPWFFYFTSLSDSLRGFFVIGGIGAIAIAGMAWLFGVVEEVFQEKTIRNLKRITLISVIFFILGIFIPSKETCYQMMTASLVTPNNIEAVGNTATDIVDYIVESVDKILNEDEESTEIE
jgi:hypothetical protein